MNRAIAKRESMSPHSPARVSQELASSSPKRSSPTNAQKLRSKAMLSSTAFITLNDTIQTIFAKAIQQQPLDPYAYVADELRHAGLIRANNYLSKSPSQKLRMRIEKLEEQVDGTDANALPPIRPIAMKSTQPNPRHRQHLNH
jgi:hypothetical protein|tara:strand:- start:182 stop:610 length:429 start_codon:yes stop_codon:yes gene_type:complete